MSYQSADADTLKRWVDSLLAEHADLDAVLLVAGMQNKLDLANDPYDAAEVQREIYVNLISPMSLIGYLIPHMKQVAASGRSRKSARDTNEVSLFC